MNIIVQNKRGLEFDLCDLDIRISHYSIEDGVVWYHIEVLLSQVWRLKKRYSEFDEMHRRLRRDLDPINLPKLPEKRYFNMNPEFIEIRLRSLHEYLKSVILIYEALENPILQRFLEIDVTYDPNFEYAPIEFSKGKEGKMVRKKELKEDKDTHKPGQSKKERADGRKARRKRMNSGPHSPHVRRKSSRRRGRERSRRRPDSFKRMEKLKLSREEIKRNPSHDDSIEFFPEEFEKKEDAYTGIGIPKSRYFDPKMEAPIAENDPDHLSLEGASDPFPLSPQELEEKREKDEELEELTKKMKAMKVKVEDIPNMSYSKLDMDLNESVRNFQDEYEHFDENSKIDQHSNEYALKSLVKRATLAINDITKENAEYFELKHRANDIDRSLDSCGQYFKNLNERLKKMAQYFQEKEKGQAMDS